VPGRKQVVWELADMHRLPDLDLDMADQVCCGDKPSLF
jgi:hypothetical protein